MSVREARPISAVSTETRAEILSLRASGFPPKAIARRLGLAPHVVAETVRAEAAKRPQPAGPEPRCWVSAGWSGSVEAPPDRGWADAGGRPADPALPSLVQVAVFGPHRDPQKLWFCGYLLDVHCLGVKDAMGPRVIPKTTMGDLINRYFSAFSAPPVPAPVELARELVFGAVRYAGSLGFSPHPDFRRASCLLGEPPGEISLKFGWHGRPFYVSGPYDHPEAVLRTLRTTVGEGNFDFCVGASPDSTFWDD